MQGRGSISVVEGLEERPESEISVKKFLRGERDDKNSNWGGSSGDREGKGMLDSYANQSKGLD